MLIVRPGFSCSRSISFLSFLHFLKGLKLYPPMPYYYYIVPQCRESSPSILSFIISGGVTGDYITLCNPALFDPPWIFHLGACVTCHIFSLLFFFFFPFSLALKNQKTRTKTCDFEAKSVINTWPDHLLRTNSI